MTNVGHFIAGQQTELTSSHKTMDLMDPATGKKSKEVILGTVQDVEHCVNVAQEAFKSWQETSTSKRGKVLWRFKELLEQNQKSLIQLISAEHGKTLEDARGEFYRGLEVVQYACGLNETLKGEYSENVSRGVDCHTLRKPLGVCVGITPFNFPVMVPMWMFPIAIAAGNSFILKPSEKDPSASLLLAKLFCDAGLPPGVFNVLQGDKVVVDALLDHPHVAAVSFVGSTPVAKYIYQRGSTQGKRVQALGGAKNHCLISPDAPWEQAVGGLMGAAFGSAGERCMAISVGVAIGEETGDRLVTDLKEQMASLKVGSGQDPQVDMGPLITEDHYHKVLSYIDLGVKEGAQLVVDGRSLKLEGAHAKGYFLGPCLFDRVTPEMRIYQEEIFGPVLSLVRAADFAEALGVVNQHPYGNGAAIYTKSGEMARAFTSQVTCGMVGVNVAIPVPVASHSFGGWKESRFGEPIYGPQGFRFYTRLKTITSRWLAPEGRQANFVMPSSN